MNLPGWQSILNITMRILSFVATLGLVGSFALPWVRLDGFEEPRNGFQVLAMSISPVARYFFNVSPIQTGVLVGGTLFMLALALRVSMQYARRKTSMFATAGVFALSLTVTYGVPGADVYDAGSPYVGLTLASILSAMLMLHQSLVKFATGLMMRRMWNPVYRTLRMVTGSA